MNQRYLFVSAFAALVLLAGAFFTWRFSVSSQNALESAIRQYEQVQSKLERYVALSRGSGSNANGNENLFAGVNRIAARCGVGSRLENLRPAGKEEENLDLQLRSLYLGETMLFISMVEELEKVNIDRLLLRRNVSNLLDLELRIKRIKNGK